MIRNRPFFTSFIDARSSWGTPPWQIDFHPPKAAVPPAVDFAIVGAGFSGLTAAAWLRRLAPEKSVAVFEATGIGAGASGRTGGLVLAETAAGDLPGLGDVLAGLADILKELGVACDLSLPGAWEIARREASADSPTPQPSPIEWNDSGTLRVIDEVPGGTLDPGKLTSGLARAAHRLGASTFENQPVHEIVWDEGAELLLKSGRVRVGKILLAANALSLSLSGLNAGTHPALTLATATAPLKEDQIAAIGLGERKPFYTVDLPYLWGRMCADNSIVWGAGLVHPHDGQDLRKIDIAAAEPLRLFATLEKRVHGLHPALASAEFTHRWGGPILFRDGWRPVFARHPQSDNGIVLGCYAGHGVALSVYFGAWAAEALLGRRDLPEWSRLNLA